uniref:Uncharacterized protein n=1 Tax=Anguilla anguilla TaxID=7936 RepID=A0A0E9X5S6_ANGAN
MAHGSVEGTIKGKGQCHMDQIDFVLLNICVCITLWIIPLFQKKVVNLFAL